MSYSLSGFDANKVKPAEAFDLLKPDWYKVIILESEEVKTANGKGKMLIMTLQIIEGEHKNRRVYERLNMENENQMAVEIAQRDLSAICHAVGVLTPRESSQLHNKPFMVKVGIDPAKGEYAAKNVPKGYKATSTGPVEENNNAPKTDTQIWGGDTGPDEASPPSATKEPDGAPWGG